MEHLFHYILMALPLVVYGLFLIKNDIKKHPFVLLALFLFLALHASPTMLLLAHHHETQNTHATHTCCIPQASTTVTPLAAPVVQISIVHPRQIDPQIPELPHLSSINNKSPPFVV